MLLALSRHYFQQLLQLRGPCIWGVSLELLFPGHILGHSQVTGLSTIPGQGWIPGTGGGGTTTLLWTPVGFRKCLHTSCSPFSQSLRWRSRGA